MRYGRWDWWCHDCLVGGLVQSLEFVCVLLFAREAHIDIDIGWSWSYHSSAPCGCG